MNDTERIGEWCRYYENSQIKMNALSAVYETDGERVLQGVLKKLGLASASDLVKACLNDWKNSGLWTSDADTRK